MPLLALAIEVVYSAVVVVMREVAHGELVDMSSSLWGAVQRGRNANGFRAIVSGSVSVIETYAELLYAIPPIPYTTSTTLWSYRTTHVVLRVASASQFSRPLPL